MKKRAANIRLLATIISMPAHKVVSCLRFIVIFAPLIPPLLLTHNDRHGADSALTFPQNTGTS
jgi:hypothetical protein